MGRLPTSPRAVIGENRNGPAWQLAGSAGDQRHRGPRNPPRRPSADSERHARKRQNPTVFDSCTHTDHPVCGFSHRSKLCRNQSWRAAESGGTGPENPRGSAVADSGSTKNTCVRAGWHYPIQPQEPKTLENGSEAPPCRAMIPPVSENRRPDLERRAHQQPLPPLRERTDTPRVAAQPPPMRRASRCSTRSPLREGRKRKPCWSSHRGTAWLGLCWEEPTPAAKPGPASLPEPTVKPNREHSRRTQRLGQDWPSTRPLTCGNYLISKQRWTPATIKTATTPMDTSHEAYKEITNLDELTPCSNPPGTINKTGR